MSIPDNVQVHSSRLIGEPPGPLLEKSGVAYVDYSGVGRVSQVPETAPPHVALRKLMAFISSEPRHWALLAPGVELSVTHADTEYFFKECLPGRTVPKPYKQKVTFRLHASIPLEAWLNAKDYADDCDAGTS